MTDAGQGGLAAAASAVSRHVMGLRVDAASPDRPDLPWRCRALLEEQQAGSDPTAPWRSLLGASTEAQYRRPAPAAMPAAFVLQWSLEAVAIPLAHAAALGPWLVDPSGISFAVQPSMAYPVAVRLGRVEENEGTAAARRGAARDRYADYGRAFASSYDPGVKMGSRQRLGMVDDCWELAWRAAHEQGLAPPHPPRVERRSCCFIYALPGAHECAGCPRQGSALSR